MVAHPAWYPLGHQDKLSNFLISRHTNFVLKSVREKFARIKDFVNPQEMEMKESIKVSERTSLLRVRRFPKEPPIKVSERNPPPS